MSDTTTVDGTNWADIHYRGWVIRPTKTTMRKLWVAHHAYWRPNKGDGRHLTAISIEAAIEGVNEWEDSQQTAKITAALSDGSAHVIHKVRHGGGRDGESYYAVLPTRATKEEAEADLRRWEACVWLNRAGIEVVSKPTKPDRTIAIGGDARHLVRSVQSLRTAVRATPAFNHIDAISAVRSAYHRVCTVLEDLERKVLDR